MCVSASPFNVLNRQTSSLGLIGMSNEDSNNVSTYSFVTLSLRWQKCHFNQSQKLYEFVQFHLQELIKIRNIITINFTIKFKFPWKEFGTLCPKSVVSILRKKIVGCFLFQIKCAFFLFALLVFQFKRKLKLTKTVKN